MPLIPTGCILMNPAPGGMRGRKEKHCVSFIIYSTQPFSGVLLVGGNSTILVGDSACPQQFLCLYNGIHEFGPNTSLRRVQARQSCCLSTPLPYIMLCYAGLLCPTWSCSLLNGVGWPFFVSTYMYFHFSTISVHMEGPTPYCDGMRCICLFIYLILPNVQDIQTERLHFRYWYYLDPIGAIFVSVYILYTWMSTGWDHLSKLSGRSAKPEFINRIIKVRAASLGSNHSWKNHSKRLPD